MTYVCNTFCKLFLSAVRVWSRLQSPLSGFWKFVSEYFLYHNGTCSRHDRESLWIPGRIERYFSSNTNSCSRDKTRICQQLFSRLCKWFCLRKSAGHQLIWSNTIVLMDFRRDSRKSFCKSSQYLYMTIIYLRYKAEINKTFICK